MGGRRFLLPAFVLVLAGCSRKTPVPPPLSDEPVLSAAARKDLQEFVPGYGIAVSGSQFEVSLEADDGPLVREGQAATVFVLPDRAPVPCRVVRVLRRVSEETGQSLAWLSPAGKASVPVNEFIYANILVRLKRGALTVPAPAVLSRDGRLLVVAEVGGRLSPVAVSTGIASGEDVEVLSGLSQGQRVAVRGGLSYLYPDFKSQGGD